jgi:hypothetical protein
LPPLYKAAYDRKSFYAYDKGDTDSYTRLPGQIKEYDTYFQQNYLVIGAAHRKTAAKHIPLYWGIMYVSESKNNNH